MVKVSEIDGVDVTGAIDLPNTGGWQSWETIIVNDIPLTAGEHVMRLAFDSDYFNLNYMAFEDVITGIEKSESETVTIYPNPFSLEGMQIKMEGDFRYRIVEVSGSLVESGYGNNIQTIGINLKPGIYKLSIENNKTLINRKIVKE